MSALVKLGATALLPRGGIEILVASCVGGVGVSSMELGLIEDLTGLE